MGENQLHPGFELDLLSTFLSMTTFMPRAFPIVHTHTHTHTLIYMNINSIMQICIESEKQQTGR